jgi:hypothetical protein
VGSSGGSGSSSNQVTPCRGRRGLGTQGGLFATAPAADRRDVRRGRRGQQRLRGRHVVNVGGIAARSPRRSSTSTRRSATSVGWRPGRASWSAPTAASSPTTT